MSLWGHVARVHTHEKAALGGYDDRAVRCHGEPVGLVTGHEVDDAGHVAAPGEPDQAVRGPQARPATAVR